MGSSARTVFIWLAIVGVIVGSCGGQTGPTRSEQVEGGEAALSFYIGKVTAGAIDSAEVVVTGSGMSDITQPLNIAGDRMTGIVRGIPTGDRTFTINTYDGSPRLTYTGSETAKVVAGQTTQVRITLRSTDGSTSAVVLTLLSPVSATYEYRTIEGYLEISGEINNPSAQTATDVRITLTARNASGAAMDQRTQSIGTVPPGRKFFSFRFSTEVFGASAAPARTIDYSIEHSLGGPDTGSVTLSGG